MPRNHHTSALLRGCRQVPNWYKWGGRTNPYALEWLSLTSGSEFYSADGSLTGNLIPTDFTISMWIKTTAPLSSGLHAVFGTFNGVVSNYAIMINGTTNTIEFFTSSQGSVAQTLIAGGAWCNITLIG